MLYERKDSIVPVILKAGDKYQSVFGAFLHSSIIGKEYGSVVGAFCRLTSLRLRPRRETSTCTCCSRQPSCGRARCERAPRSSLPWTPP